MTRFSIESVDALEILDSRGRPTVQVELALAGLAPVTAGVPAGASTGSGEAVELRDGDTARYAGRGVTRAVASVRGEIRELLLGADWHSLGEVDAALIELDGSEGKKRLGANAIIGASMALARALAAAAGQPLHDWLRPHGVTPRLPVPHFNVLNGGEHAPNALDFQEFMIAPLGAPTMAEAVRAGADVYAALRGRLAAAGYATGLGDEGGFAPDIAEPEHVLALLVAAIEEAGYQASLQGVAIALDPAASYFRESDGRYRVDGALLGSTDLVERYAEMVAGFPIWSIEDGMAEDDDDGWSVLTQRLGDRMQLVGDDNFVTNPAVIRRAIEAGIANAALIKPNQIGTVTETLAAMALCRTHGYTQMISHRSGETPDTFIADLAVATGCGQLKSGAPARGERIAKYNRLLEIEARHVDLPFGLPDDTAHAGR